MLGLANYNDKDVIVSSISPALTYDNLERYQSVLNKIYAHIMNITTEHNGKVAEIYN
jgi:hypothetical protein